MHRVSFIDTVAFWEPIFYTLSPVLEVPARWAAVEYIFPALWF